MVKNNTQLQTFLWSVPLLGLLPHWRLWLLVLSESLERVKVGRSQWQVKQENSPNWLRCPKLRVYSWDSTQLSLLQPYLHTIYASKLYWKRRPPSNHLSGPHKSHNHANFGKEPSITGKKEHHFINTIPLKCRACCFDKQIYLQIYKKKSLK